MVMRIHGAQVVVRDADGHIPESLWSSTLWTISNRNQEWTSDDGLFVAINVPEGDWVIETWVSDGAGGHLLVGERLFRFTQTASTCRMSMWAMSLDSATQRRLGDAPIDTGDPVDTGDTGGPAPVDSDGDGIPSRGRLR